jgi:hypothetical protein
MDSYQYTPLSGEDAIRVLHLHPGVGPEAIQCNLVHTSFDDAPPYEGLSYVWGSSSKDFAIRCNEKTLAVTRSVHEALKHLRHPTETRVLWVDAVAIDQDNLLEKNDQVAKMSKIYQKAKRSICFLGPKGEHTDQGFGLLRKISARLCEDSATNPTDIVGLAKCSDAKTFRSMVGKTALETVRDIGDEEEWAGLGEIFQRPWFNRIWGMISSHQHSGIPTEQF